MSDQQQPNYAALQTASQQQMAASLASIASSLNSLILLAGTQQLTLASNKPTEITVKGEVRTRSA